MNLNDLKPFKGTIEVDGISVDIDIKDTAYLDEKYFIRDGKSVFVAYLCHDPDADNPLEDGGCMGAIYTSNRWSDTLKHMQAALGLNQYGVPDLEHEAVRTIAAPKVLAALMANPKFVERARQQFELSTDDEVRKQLWDAYLNPETYKRSWIARDFPGAPAEEDTFDQESWREARMTGKLGSPFAILVDAYEHGLVQYSPSGEGMQDRWDTSHGAAVWVPDSGLEPELWNEALKTADGHVRTVWGRMGWQPDSNGIDYGNGVKQSPVMEVETVYVAEVDGKPVSEHTSFDAAREAVITTLGEKYDVAKAVEAARARAREAARQACDEYSEWSNGQNYFVTVEHWKLIHEDGDIAAKYVDNVCGGSHTHGEDPEAEIIEFMREEFDTAEA